MIGTPAPLNSNSDDESEDLDAREPWMWAGKRAFIFLIDATNIMFEQQFDDSSHITTCIESCKRVMLQNIYQKSKDLFGIVLYGTKHKGQAAQPNHVTTLQELSSPDADKINDLINILEDIDGFEKKNGHSNDFSLAEALWHCHKMFSSCTTKIHEKIIFLMTCNDNPHAANAKLQNDTRVRAQNLASVEIKLEILPFGLTFDGKLFFKEVLKLACDDDSDDCPEIKPLQKVEDVIYHVQRAPSKRSVCRVLWSLGNDVKLGVAAYRFVRSAPPYPDKKRVERLKNTVVTSRVQAFNADTGEQVTQADITKAIKFEKKTVTFEKEELRNVKQITQPGLILLGFKPITTMKIWFHIKESLFLYPEERIVQGSRTLFAALHEKCLSRKVAPICYFTSRRTAKPALVALLPQAEVLDKDCIQHVPPGFVLHYLPYSDNIRDLKEQQVSCPAPELELIEIAEKIVDKVKFKYKPSIIDNPKLTTLWAGIEALALGYSEPDETCDHTIPDYEMMDQKLGQLSVDFMNMAFPGGFDEDVVKKAIKRSAPAKQPVAKKVKPDLDNMSMEDIASQGQVEKLTVDKLKQYLSSEGVKVGKMKKAELVEAVYHHFGVDQPGN